MLMAVAAVLGVAAFVTVSRCGARTQRGSVCMNARRGLAARCRHHRWQLVTLTDAYAVGLGALAYATLVLHQAMAS